MKNISIKLTVSLMVEWGLIASLSYSDIPPSEWEGKIVVSSSLSTNNPVTFQGGLASLAFGSPVAAASQSMTTLAITAPVSSEVDELAAALEYDPVKVYEYVRNNIEYDTQFGWTRSPERTIVDQMGTNPDQAVLLFELLEACGLSPAYESGFVQVPVSGNDGYNIQNWIGVESYQEARFLLKESGYRYYEDAAPEKLIIEHYWVKVTVDSVEYRLDPSFKPQPFTQAKDILDLAGYDRTNLLSIAGGTADTNEVSSMNETNLRTHLELLSTSLSDEATELFPNSEVFDILGGREIIPEYGLSDLKVFTPYSTTTTNIMLAPMHYVYFADSFYGAISTVELGTQKLTVQIAADGVTATILYDDSIKYFGGISVGGAATVKYIQPNFYLNNGSWVFFWDEATRQYAFPASSTNAFALCLGNSSHVGMLKNHSGILSKSIAEGADSGSILRSSLHVMGDSWMEQFTLTRNINERLFDGRISRRYAMGQFSETSSGYFMDIPHIYHTTLGHSTLEEAYAGARAPMFLSSALEHGVLEQKQPNTADAVSTIELLTLTSRSGLRVFHATTQNYSYVSTQLINYDTNDLQTISNLISNEYKTLILPEDGEIGHNSWTGMAYIAAKGTGIGFTIQGGLNGGHNTTDDPFNPYDVNNEIQNWYYDEFGNLHPLSPEPVDMVTGAYVLDHDDLSMNGPLELNLSRHYSSQSRSSNKMMGYGWNHSFNIYAQSHSDTESMFGLRSTADAMPIALAVAATKDILANEDNPKGWMTAVLITKWAMDQLTQNAVSIYIGQKVMTFIEQPDGLFTPPPGMTVSLTETNGAYIMQERNGSSYAFSTNGLIETISDPDTNTLSFTYTGGTNLYQITSSFGPQFTFGYAGGLLTSVSDNSGRSVSYQYDAANNLTNFVDAAGKSWGITYDTDHKIKTLIDPEGITTIQNFYNSAGQVTNQISATSNPWNFYFTGKRNVEEDPYGNQTAYYIDGQQRTWSIEKADGTRTYMFHDGQNHITNTVNEAGVTNIFIYDTDHNLLAQTNAFGTSAEVASHYGYDAEHHLRFVTNAVGTAEQVVTEYTYTATHHIDVITEAKGAAAVERETDLDYYGDGLLKKRTEGNGKRVTDYTYDGNGNPDTVASTDVGTIDYLYDLRGDVREMQLDGKTTTYSYNAHRQLTGIQYEDTTFTTNTYWDNGLLKRTLDRRSNPTDYYWTPAYKQAGIVFPDNGTTTNLYDNADRLVMSRDAEGNWATNTLDAIGRPVSVSSVYSVVTNQFDVVGNITNSVVDPTGLYLQTRFAYDALNRLTHNYRPIGLTEYQLDALGRTTNRVDAATKDWKTVYDDLGRVKKSYRPSANYEEYGYDSLGNRTQFWNAEFKPMTFGVDAQGRITSITNAINKVIGFVYDDAGNLSQRTAADLKETDYGYDGLNRLVTVTNDGVEVATFDHDGNGNITSMANDISAVSLGYDSMNRLTASTQTVGSATAVVGSQYDLNGSRTHVTYPGGTNAVFVYGGGKRLESVDLSSFGIAADFEFQYDGANRLTNMVYPNGVNSSFGYDDNGYVTSIKHGSFVARTIQRNVLGFKETELIDTGVKPTAPETRRSIKTHNDADQLVSESIQTDTTNWVAVAYSYSENGCLTNVSQASLPAVNYSYDYDNRLLTADGVEYIYDASGARVGRVNGSTTNYFVVDYADGLKRPLAETDSSGIVTRYYVWAGPRLLCHIDADGSTRYYHSDELGSTLALTDESGNVTDQFAYMPYGFANHSGSTSTPFQWLGGYGVYYDSNTELHLTLHRAYSCAMKRFISADPLGIDGGINVYAMANLNPLTFVDPYGLASMTSWDMYQHYKNGGGNLTLQQMELLYDVQHYSTTQEKISKFNNQINTKAEQLASQYLPGVYDFNDSFERSYPYEKHKFAFGDATLSGDFSGTLTVYPDGSYSYVGEAGITFHDYFTDPYDTFDWFKGEWNPDGTPYNIDGLWTEYFVGGYK